MINLSNILVILSIIALVLALALSRRATFRIAISATTASVIYTPVIYLCRKSINAWLRGVDFDFLNNFSLTEDQKFFFVRGLLLIGVMVALFVLLFCLTSLLVKKVSPFDNTKKRHSVVYFALRLYNWTIVTTWIIPFLVELNYLMQLDLGYLSGLFEIVFRIGGGA